MGQAVLADAGARATAVLSDWIEARYDRVVACFEARMTERLPPEALAAAWPGSSARWAPNERMGEPLVRQVGDYTVAEIPLSFEAAEMKGRAVYNRSGQVSGVFVIKPDTP